MDYSHYSKQVCYFLFLTAKYEITNLSAWLSQAGNHQLIYLIYSDSCLYAQADRLVAWGFGVKVSFILTGQ
jgi:hypothetical protein